jgi:YidC/Oxa1 family membrane protein insertase
MKLSKFLKANDPLVVYSEGLAYRTFLASTVERYAEKGLPVAYVTSKRDDFQTSWESDKITNFYVGFGAKRTWFFQTLSARVILMTMPDLDTFHIKRSVNPVHYVYTQHSLSSLHMVYREGAHDAFDTIFSAGPHHSREIRALEFQRGLTKRNIVESGYPLLDDLIAEYGSSISASSDQNQSDEPIKVLIAPSWGPDGLLENSAIEVVQPLIADGFEVILRPHIRTVQLRPDVIRLIEDTFGSNSLFSLDLNPSGAESFERASVMISAWSGVSIEFAFGYRKPVISVNVPRKNFNPNYSQLGLEPFEVSIREKIGRICEVHELSNLPDLVRSVMGRPELDIELRDLASESVINLGNSAKIAANYLELLMQSGQGNLESRVGD